MMTQRVSSKKEQLAILDRESLMIHKTIEEYYVTKYVVNNSTVETVLSWVNAGEIAIPEINVLFVWNASKVRDLMDSLYQGLSCWISYYMENPDTNLKDGTTLFPW